MRVTSGREMSFLSKSRQGGTPRSRVLFSLLVLLAFGAQKAVGQGDSAGGGSRTSIEAHFAAAEEARQRRDLTTAEQEYRSVVVLAPNFAEAHMNLGLIYQLQHRNNEAMAEFSRALETKPSLAGANFFLGVDYCNLGQGRKAVPYLRAAVQADVNLVDSWSWLATALEMSGDLSAEIATLKRALSIHRDNIDLLYQLGHAYERMGKREADALDSKASYFLSERLLAESYASSSEWPSAVIHFENALAASPNLFGLHAELGEVFLQAGKLERAATEFDAELRINGHSLRALVRRGEVKLIGGDIDGCLRDWTRATSIDASQSERVLGLGKSGPDDLPTAQLPEVLRSKLAMISPQLRLRTGSDAELALAFIAQQNDDGAQNASSELTPLVSNGLSSPAVRCSQSQVNRLLDEEKYSGVVACGNWALPASSPLPFRMRVVAAMLEAGNSDHALAVLSGVPHSARHLPETSYWFARCYEKLATSTYLRLYKSNPDSYRAHELLGDLEAARGEDEEAMAEYRAAIQSKPTSPNLHYDLGHLLWKNLKTDEARRELEAELAITPNHSGALNDLGDTYLMDHQPDKALEYLNRAVALDADSPGIHRDLGTAYSELGDYNRASAELSIALPSDRDGSIHFKLGRAYQALGQTDKAKRQFELSELLNRQSHSRLEKQTERLAEAQR
jgi:tetratricopeptide (TPR) repeat protein